MLVLELEHTLRLDSKENWLAQTRTITRTFHRWVVNLEPTNDPPKKAKVRSNPEKVYPKLFCPHCSNNVVSSRYERTFAVVPYQKRGPLFKDLCLYLSVYNLDPGITCFIIFLVGLIISSLATGYMPHSDTWGQFALRSWRLLPILILSALGATFVVIVNTFIRLQFHKIAIVPVPIGHELSQRLVRILQRSDVQYYRCITQLMVRGMNHSLALLPGHPMRVDHPRYSLKLPPKVYDNFGAENPYVPKISD